MVGRTAEANKRLGQRVLFLLLPNLLTFFSALVAAQATTRLVFWKKKLVSLKWRKDECDLMKFVNDFIRIYHSIRLVQVKFPISFLRYIFKLETQVLVIFCWVFSSASNLSLWASHPMVLCHHYTNLEVLVGPHSFCSSQPLRKTTFEKEACVYQNLKWNPRKHCNEFDIFKNSQLFSWLHLIKSAINKLQGKSKVGSGLIRNFISGNETLINSTTCPRHFDVKQKLI